MEQPLREHLRLRRSLASVHHSNPRSWTREEPSRREFPRLEIHCRARIRIGNRQYAGYLHNISQGGARLRTITPIRKLGAMILRLPDLPALRCELRWTDSYNAGVSFGTILTEEQMCQWAKTRVGEPNFSRADLTELVSADGTGTTPFEQGPATRSH